MKNCGIQQAGEHKRELGEKWHVVQVMKWADDEEKRAGPDRDRQSGCRDRADDGNGLAPCMRLPHSQNTQIKGHDRSDQCAEADDMQRADNAIDRRRGAQVIDGCHPFEIGDQTRQHLSTM